MAFLKLTVTMTSASETLRLSGPVLPITTPPDQALEALDELHDTLTTLGWTSPDGLPVKATGRVHVVAAAGDPPGGPAACVYAASDLDRAAARSRASAALLTAQLAAART